MASLILCVEDNSHNLRLVRKMLEGAGYAVVEALNGASGIAAAERHQPDLILLDINLPDMDGVEVCSRIRTITSVSWVPIIALTANAMHGDREMYLSQGMDGYLPKPVTKTELINTLRMFLGTGNE
ncbi:MAG: response regulator [Phototrophicaceae bacterium]